MRGRALRHALFATALPTMLSAQVSELQPRTVLAAAGLGTGLASFSCDGCASQRDPGISGMLRMGTPIRSDLAVFAELSRWSKGYENAQGTASIRLLFLDVAAQWYPRPGIGQYVKSGLGVASIREDLVVTAVGPSDISSTSPALILGGGWNFPVARRWEVTPYADFNYALKSNPSVNGTRVSQKLSGSLLHLGVLVSLGKPRTVVAPVIPVVVNQDSLDRAERARQDSLAALERERFAADSVARAEAIARESEAVRVALTTVIHFEFGKSELTDSARTLLDAKVPLLLANPEVSVRIGGHTDARGTEGVNRDLSQRRASAARDYLISRGVGAARIDVVNYGKERPLCDSSDESCQARNRRTEFEITSSAPTLKRP